MPMTFVSAFLGVFCATITYFEQKLHNYMLKGRAKIDLMFTIIYWLHVIITGINTINAFCSDTESV